MRRSIKLAAVGVLGAVSMTTALAANERAGADREPANEDGVVARAGNVVVSSGEDGAVARAGDVEARAGGAQPAPERRDEGDTQSRGGEEGDAAVEDGQVLMRIRGDEGVGFSGTCTVGGEERVLEGQVPEEFTFALNGGDLECEIRKTGGTGTLKMVLLSENSRTVQAVSGGTTRIFLSGDGDVSSSTSSSSTSSSSVSSVSQSSSVVQSTSSSTDR